MLRHLRGRSLLATGVLTLAVMVACDVAPPTAPRVEPLAAAAFAESNNAADIERGTFSFPAPPAARVNAPCVDPDAPLRVIGTWSGWFRVARTAGGHLRVTEHIDWSDVTLVAADGRTWRAGPGAHESFSFNRPATADDVGETATTNMHNLRARFLSQDGDSDLQVWHTIQIVRGPDLEFRVFKVVLPFQGRCIGGRS